MSGFEAALKRFVASWLLLAALPFATSPASAQTASDHYHWRPAAEDAAPRPWMLLLTGASGIYIGRDPDHYYRAAAWLNARGVDALIVDYQQAVRLLPNAAQAPSPGERISVVVTDAVAGGRARGRISENCPAGVTAWSLGAEGGWLLARDNPYRLRGAAMYYPTALVTSPYRNTIPILVLQGEADDVTPLNRVRDFIAARPADSAPIKLVSFAGAYHGFDVPSLPPEPPPPSPLPPGAIPGTFVSNRAATASAEQALETFWRNVGVIAGRCTGY